MNEPIESSAQEDKQFHTYVTHRIPWYVRTMWIGFWIGAIWYVVKFAIPMAKNYF
jgi:hypothetical protein